MCGIVGYVGKNKKALSVLITGLKNLEYRGYDSAGVCFLNDDNLEIVKEKGKIINLEKKIGFNIESNLGIGHTRWATHGEANQVNSHPHQVGKITLVHNGIIENYIELKEMLVKKGYMFKSDTDSEVACALIDYLYSKNDDMKKVMEKAILKLEGSYALGIVIENDDKLYTLKNNSPLIIGIGDNENYIASDVPAILDYTNKYLLLDDKEYAIISNNEISIYNQSGLKMNKVIKVFEGDLLAAKKDGYDHFMQKEMFEQPKVFKKIIKEYLSDGIDMFKSKMPDFNKYNRIDIVACGSAYHAGLVGKNLIEEYGNIEVNVDIASEYRYKKLFVNEKSLVILISQSGETADTLAALKIVKEKGADTLAIVNVVDSSIARAADMVLYTNAGPEIAVATTKAYLAQVTILALIALKMYLENNSFSETELLNDINLVPNYMNELLNKDYVSLANNIYENDDIYFLGRKVDYALAMEGSLKLKEISYIHSEAYAAGELKHGTISLIEENTPVIGILTDDSIISKTISNIKETKARGSKVVVIRKENIVCENDYEMVIPECNKLFQPILAVIPLQRLSYEVAKLRGCNIDKPKNLAKSVTVE